MRTPTTRTIGPLHLEDLEPHRFEDLVRQLIYDFRNWRSLEATGRSGSDDGFDVRGTEIVAREGMGLAATSTETEAHEDFDEFTEVADDRIWLIQCKREKAINPKKLVAYLDGLPKAEMYGVIFAAACDFSKAARDAFRSKVLEFGFVEAQLWGKGELEDMLFQPKNDYLLFAYFGFSLQARRRVLRTEVRSRLAMKRKTLRLLHSMQIVLIRDASDERYPYPAEDKSLRMVERRRWLVRRLDDFSFEGLRIACARHFAYLGDDGEEWDYAEHVNDASLSDFEDPWGEPFDHAAREIARGMWDKLPDANRAWFEVIGIVPYERIIDIDEKGDDHFDKPQIFTDDFDLKRGPFKHFYMTLTAASGEVRNSPARERRVTKFPRP